MSKFSFGICSLLLTFSLTLPVQAQVLDAEEAPDAAAPAPAGLSFDETDKNEALFNEMFGDHPEIREDAENTGNFENTAQKAAERIKQTGATAPSVSADGILKPLNGDMLIGVSKGSFKVFQDMTGRTNCTFGVTLKSNLDRELKTMGRNWSIRIVFSLLFSGTSPKKALRSGLLRQPETFVIIWRAYRILRSICAGLKTQRTMNAPNALNGATIWNLQTHLKIHIKK